MGLGESRKMDHQHMEARCGRSTGEKQTEAVDIGQLNRGQDKGALRISVSGLSPYIDYLVKRAVIFLVLTPRKKKDKSPGCTVACCTVIQLQSTVYLTDQTIKKKMEKWKGMRSGERDRETDGQTYLVPFQSWEGWTSSAEKANML